MCKIMFSLVILVGVLSSLATSEELGEHQSLVHSFGGFANYFQDVKTSYLDDIAELVKRVEELKFIRGKNAHKFSESMLELERLRENDTQTIKHLSDEIIALLDENKFIKSKLNGRYHQRAAKSISLDTQRSGSSPGTIAFYTSLSQLMISPGRGQRIPFDNITTNVNASISNHTGVFTCTRSGVHVFSWQTLLAESNYMVTELVRNGTSIGAEELASVKTSVSDSSTAVLDLVVGEEVWVRVADHAGGSDVQPHLTTFSGFRLP